MLNKLKKRNEGFTIIEVLIVLAIAGLILLVVFLAVPALQRNSRNTQRKADVSAVLGAVQEFSNSNAGTLPGSATLSGNIVYLCATGTCTSADSSAAKIGYYNSATTPVSVASTVPATAPTTDQIVLVKGSICNGNTPTLTGASARAVTAWYKIEANVLQCQES
jgi:prepilin-type N-terminal cleavage/methylation domain-containing protein